MAIKEPVRGPFPVTRPRNIEDHARPDAGECAVVLLGTELRRMPKGEVPTSGIGFYRPKGKYWIVDLRERTTTLTVELDSADKGLRFHGSIEVDWCVSNAEAAAEQHPFDVQRMLRRRIVDGLGAQARHYALDAVGDLESWINGQRFTGPTDKGLLEILAVSCALRPDVEATGITRTGTLNAMQRDQAAKVLSEGKAGLMAEAMIRNPEAAFEFYRDQREDERAALLVHLEMAKAVVGADGSEEHEKAHVINELIAQLRGTLPASATQLPSAGSANAPRQLGEGRSRRRDRRSRERRTGDEDTVLNGDADSGGGVEQIRDGDE
ncbi:hypothetical protein [Streptomyces gilvus]|uniref:hypothetical protein n=1 Tax=Streptomyces gilvus TaxID=2920937 RepID=UPI001F0F771C|nr:hypothetical protein [Streptomyces sp. CME 23]MCH5677353.1 hypothetical protein [Streptomyces sp. CME 23]